MMANWIYKEPDLLDELEDDESAGLTRQSILFEKSFCEE
jgi:hypothetical protein